MSSRQVIRIKKVSFRDFVSWTYAKFSIMKIFIADSEENYQWDLRSETS